MKGMGARVTDMYEAVRTGDILITCTGNIDVITRRHFELMKDGALLTNAGHFNVEIDVKSFEKMATDVEEVRPYVKKFTLPDRRRLFLLAEGRLVNIVAGDGHPIEIMDLSFSLQFMSILYLAR